MSKNAFISDDRVLIARGAEPGSVQLGPAQPKRIRIATAVELGAFVRAVRKRRKITQAEFADLAGVGRRFLIELEQGKPRLELGKVLTVLNAAGIDLIVQER